MPIHPRHLLLAAIIALAVVLRCYNIEQGLWWDEIWSTMEYATARSWWYTVSELGFYFNNHPLYSILCRISIGLLGVSELSVRLPSVIMGVAALPVLYCLARPHIGSSAALLAAFLLAISAFHIDHSTEARGYAGMMLFALLASLFFLEALSAPRFRTWALFTLCTFLGFYCHAYMAQVPLVQVLCCGLLLVEQTLRRGRTQFVYPGALKQFALALGAGAFITLAAYAPMLKDFIANAGKVQMLSVDRLPFVVEMYETVLPGFTTLPGRLLYSALFVCGLLYLRRRSPVLLIYTLLICNVPLLLYLQLNPMFIFKRYFLPALPFCLLTIACGMEWIAGKCRLGGPARAVFFAVVLGAVVILQWPATRQIVTESRQHYREAAALVEAVAGDRERVVTAIGHAGWHFRYYVREPVIVPETFAGFMELVESGNEVWCLISAWLPDLRPAHEPALLYTEDPEHELIYAYVRAHFQCEFFFRGQFSTYVYRLSAETENQPQ